MLSLPQRLFPLIVILTICAAAGAPFWFFAVAFAIWFSINLFLD